MFFYLNMTGYVVLREDGYLLKPAEKAFIKRWHRSEPPVSVTGPRGRVFQPRAFLVHPPRGVEIRCAKRHTWPSSPHQGGCKKTRRKDSREKAGWERTPVRRMAVPEPELFFSLYS